MLKAKRLILVNLVLILLLAACSSQTTPTPVATDLPPVEPNVALDDEEINLRFTIWSSNEAHLAMLNEIAEAYNQMHPEVTVDFDFISFVDYTLNVTLELAGSNPPDAGWVVENSVSSFVKVGALSNMGPALKQSPNYDFADISESALQLWADGEAVYGIPFSTSPFFILYNRDMFEAAGAETPDDLLARDAWTWQALATAASTIVDENPPGIYGFESYDGEVYGTRVWHTLTPLIRAYGGQAWSPDGTTCLLNSDEAIAAVQLYHNMVFVDKSAVPPRERGDFYAGQSAMTITQLSQLARLKEAPFQWGIVPLPGGPAGESPVIGQAAIAVFNASRHKETAIDFVDFMTNKENVAKAAQFFPPARNSVLESDVLLKANPQVDAESMNQTIVTSIQHGTVLPTHINFSKIDLIIRVQFDTLWVPNADIEAVLTDVCESIAPLLGD